MGVCIASWILYDLYNLFDLEGNVEKRAPNVDGVSHKPTAHSHYRTYRSGVRLFKYIFIALYNRLWLCSTFKGELATPPIRTSSTKTIGPSLICQTLP